MMSQGIGWQDQLRQFLRVRLGARRYRALGVVRHRLVEMPHRPAILLAQMLPAATRVRVREAIQVVEKLDYAPRDVWLHVDSKIEHHVRRFSCAKEPDTVRWIETAFRAGEVFYDVGANVGAYSLVAWAFFRGHISVYAFEPAVVNYIQLCRNLVLNRCQHLIVPLPVALSRKAAVDTFHYQTLEPGGALHALGAAIDHQGDAFTPVWTQPVLAYRLDELIERFGLPAPNHIKIDVDGTELEVLRGAEQTLAQEALRSILVELRPGARTWQDAIRLLTEKGFFLHSHLLQPGGIANHIFYRSP